MVNDINIFDYTVLLLALIAAETAMALSLIIGSRGLSGRLSVRNNVSNYSTYLPKCQRYNGYLPIGCPTTKITLTKFVITVAAQ